MFKNFMLILVVFMFFSFFRDSFALSQEQEETYLWQTKEESNFFVGGSYDIFVSGDATLLFQSFVSLKVGHVDSYFERKGNKHVLDHSRHLALSFTFDDVTFKTWLVGFEFGLFDEFQILDWDRQTVGIGGILEINKGEFFGEPTILMSVGPSMFVRVHEVIFKIALPIGGRGSADTNVQFYWKFTASIEVGF